MGSRIWQERDDRLMCGDGGGSCEEACEESDEMPSLFPREEEENNDIEK